ncbi:hypothetical protein NWI01_00030 [Nitrobacter winogradskyi]|uniref:Uncharacterized protein n=1 Tax=Nitrobacter winogradskyi TaxID=913 RepID=A0A4Y3W7V7_NITWI|nr:hypothetical protein NWI01_00030 [Nitrobacter winogradskyi]
MVTEQLTQFTSCRVIVGKNLCVHLVQGLLHLCRIQFHNYSYAGSKSHALRFFISDLVFDQVALFANMSERLRVDIDGDNLR